MQSIWKKNKRQREIKQSHSLVVSTQAVTERSIVTVIGGVRTTKTTATTNTINKLCEPQSGFRHWNCISVHLHSSLLYKNYLYFFL